MTVLHWDLQELVINIHRRSHSILKACSLVCRGWRYASQKHLFHTIVFDLNIRTGDDYAHFLRSNPHISLYIQDLSVKLVAVINGVAPEEVALTDVLPSLRNLRSISITIPISANHNRPPWSMDHYNIQKLLLAVFSSGQVAYLQIDGLIDFSLEVIDHCPSLKHLVLGIHRLIQVESTTKEDDRQTPDLTISHNAKPQFVTLEVAINPPPFNMIKPYLSQLKELSVTFGTLVDNIDALELLLQECLSLESLVLKIYTYARSPLFFNPIDLGNLKNLRNIHLLFNLDLYLLIGNGVTRLSGLRWILETLCSIDSHNCIENIVLNARSNREVVESNNDIYLLTEIGKLLASDVFGYLRLVTVYVFPGFKSDQWSSKNFFQSVEEGLSDLHAKGLLDVQLKNYKRDIELYTQPFFLQR